MRALRTPVGSCSCSCRLKSGQKTEPATSNWTEVKAEAARTAAEQRGLALCGGRGGKDLARGEQRRDDRGPDTAPGYRVERACCRAPSGATEQECAVHRTAASHHRRSPGAELFRP